MDFSLEAMGGSSEGWLRLPSWPHHMKYYQGTIHGRQHEPETPDGCQKAQKAARTRPLAVLSGRAISMCLVLL